MNAPKIGLRLLLVTLLLGVMAVVVVARNQDFWQGLHTQLPDTGAWSRGQSSAKRTATELDSSGKNSLASFYAYRRQMSVGTPRTDLQTSGEFERVLALDERGKDRRPRSPLSPLPAIGSSITTAILFEILRARFAAKKGLTIRQLSASQNIQVCLPCLLLGLLAAIWLLVLEVSIRYVLQ